MADVSGNGNEAAVLAAITGVDRKVDVMIVKLEAVCATVGDHETRLREVERDGTTNKQQWEGHAETHKTSYTIAAALTTMASAIAGTVGVLFGK